MSNKIKRNKIRYYLYNYNNLGKLIRDRELDYISYKPINYNRFIKGMHSYNVQTIENQAIMIIEDKKLEEMKLFKEELYKTIHQLKKDKYKLYVYTYLKYVYKSTEENIKEKMKLHDLNNIDNEVMKYFENNIRVNL